MRMSRRELGILNELVKLRDRVARERDLPVNYVLPDDVVAGLATLAGQALEDFAQLRRLDAGMKRQLGRGDPGGGSARSRRLPKTTFRSGRRGRWAPARDALVSLLGAAIAEIARDAELPASLLVPRAALERLAREIPADRAELRTRLGSSAVAPRARRATHCGDCYRRGSAKDRRLRRRRSQSTFDR